MLGYLEAYTKEKIFFIAGKEFATFSMEGHILILYPKHYMGYVQVVSDSMKSCQTHFEWKDSHCVKLLQMSGCDAVVILMNMSLFM